MFIQNLDARQQSALLYLAKEVAKADGDLHESQLGLIAVLQKQCMTEIDAVEIQINELPDIFDSERSKCSLLLELIGVAHANHEYHMGEKDLIGKYAKILGISNSKLQNLNAWVEKQINLMKDVQDLLN